MGPLAVALAAMLLTVSICHAEPLSALTSVRVAVPFVATHNETNMPTEDQALFQGGRIKEEVNSFMTVCGISAAKVGDSNTIVSRTEFVPVFLSVEQAHDDVPRNAGRRIVFFEVDSAVLKRIVCLAPQFQPPPLFKRAPNLEPTIEDAQEAFGNYIELSIARM